MSGVRGGRRVAERSRPRSGGVTMAPLALLLAAVAAVALTRAPAAEPGDPGPTGALVDRALLVCPGDTTRPPVQAGLAAVADLGEGGTLEVGPPGGARAGTDLQRGRVVPVEAEHAVLDAEGAVAAGLFGHRAQQTGRVLAVGGCVPPRAGWWFTGGGATIDHTSVLSLTNVDPGPAVVDIRVLSEGGEVDPVATRGVTIAPGETRRVALSDIAPQNEELAVAVEASRGRVAATMDDRFAPRPAGPQGSEWLSAATEPSRVVRLAGVPGEAAGRSLVLGNPSGREALVELELSGTRGRFVPTGAETLTVPPGSVRVVDVSELLPSGDAVAVRVSAQVPVVATVRSVQGDDHSYAAPASALSGPAAVPVVQGSTTTLALTAAPGGAQVEVQAVDRQGEVVQERRLEVAPAATATWRAPRAAAYVLVTPVRGAVHGAAIYEGRTGTASVPLETLPLRLDVPAVVPGPR